jgi:ABC-type Zn2+ transport system substrate-binding protein/surface adhesin
MDNPLEILIYLFIIISFLSSLFRKKKKPENTTGQQTARSLPELKPEQKTSQQEDYDILREVEKMFKTETSYSEKEEETIEAGNKFEPASEHFETADWHKQTETEHKSTLSEHSFESWEDKARKAEEKRKAVNEKIVKQAEAFEKNLRKKSFQQTDIKKTIRQKFRQPTSIKEYVIFSEILGKPKSFQE